MSEVGSGFFKV